MCASFALSLSLAIRNMRACTMHKHILMVSPKRMQTLGSSPFASVDASCARIIKCHRFEMTISISFQCSRIKIWLHCLRFCMKIAHHNFGVIWIGSKGWNFRTHFYLFTIHVPVQLNRQTDRSSEWLTYAHRHARSFFFSIFLSTMIFSIPNNM